MLYINTSLFVAKPTISVETMRLIGVIRNFCERLTIRGQKLLNGQSLLKSMQDEILVHGGAGLNGTEYSMLLTTDMSKRLDELFGLKYVEKFAGYARKMQEENLVASEIDEPEVFMHIQDILAVSQIPVKGIRGEVVIPVSREADHNFRSARAFMVAYRESERVVDYFSGLARQVGFFFALPYDEVLRANNGLREDDIQEAIREGYARTGITTHVDGNPLRMLEITDKFCPLEKRVN